MKDIVKLQLQVSTGELLEALPGPSLNHSPPPPFFHFFLNVHCPLSDSHVQSFASVFTAAAPFPFEHHDFLSGFRMLRV